MKGDLLLSDTPVDTLLIRILGHLVFGLGCGMGGGGVGQHEELAKEGADMGGS